VGSVIAHMAKTAIMRHPGGSVVKALPYDNQREALPLFERVGTHVWRFSKRGLSPVVSRPHCQLKPPSINLGNPPAAMSGPDPCATRFVDSKGHSRFVLRILIILSHRSPKRALRRIAVHVVGTVNRAHRRNRDV